MDLKPRYIEARERDFDVDEFFMEKILELPYEVGIGVILLLKKNVGKFITDDDWTQVKAGVVKGKKPYFFEILYVKHTGDIPVMMDIEEIECDEYLDYINDKQVLK